MLRSGFKVQGLGQALASCGSCYYFSCALVHDCAVSCDALLLVVFSFVCRFVFEIPYVQDIFMVCTCPASNVCARLLCLVDSLLRGSRYELHRELEIS